MSASPLPVKDAAMKRRVRNGALGLAAVALAFYVGIIILLVSRSHH